MLSDLDLEMNIVVGSVRQATVPGYTPVYCGRFPQAPGGIEHAHLGNPYRVGQGYRQGEAAEAYLAYLRSACRKAGPVRRKILELARRLAQGERLRLICHCKSPRPDAQDIPCHADFIRLAVLGYARRILAAA